MKLGKVIGTVVASHKDGKISGFKFLLLQDMAPDGSLMDSTLVAVDTVGAGPDELVLYTTGSSSRYTATTHDIPVDNTIVAIVDSIEVGSKCMYDKAAKNG